MARVKSKKPCKLLDNLKEFLSPLAKDGGVNAFLKALGLVKDEKYYQKKTADAMEETNKNLAQIVKKLDEMAKG